MSPFRFVPIGLLLAAIGLSTAPALVGITAVAHAADPAPQMRPEVAKPLQAAQDLIKAQKFKEALARVREADAVGGKTANEQFTIDRMRASAAYGAGDYETAANAFEAVIATGKLAPADQQRIVQALISIHYTAKDYPKTISWLNRYFKDGGDDPKLRALLTQTYYLSGDYARAAKDLDADLRADEKAGRKPTEDQLQLQANIASKQQDKAGYAAALERLVTYYPTKEYWADLLNRVQAKPGFSDRLTLDVYRLKLASGQMKSAADYMEMAQLAMQVGFPAEAKSIVEQGYKAGLMGTGADAARHKRMNDLAVKTAADDLKTMEKGETDANANKDGTALANLGYAFVTAGQVDRGIALMEKGIAKGGMKRADDAKLHLGIAYLHADKKADAIKTFKTVQGTDGSADLSRLWVMQANNPMN
ncbi:MAG: tetratricopeptide repeat protein [Herminiimonas sp.]|nr:tetratricopeptide repeat protein [Herminiimonas sp.]